MKRLIKRKVKKLIIKRKKRMADQALLDGLQSLANQFTVEIAGTITPAPVTPPPSEPFDVKPV